MINELETDCTCFSWYLFWQNVSKCWWMIRFDLNWRFNKISQYRVTSIINKKIIKCIPLQYLCDEWWDVERYYVFTRKQFLPHFTRLLVCQVQAKTLNLTKYVVKADSDFAGNLLRPATFGQLSIANNWKVF